MRREPLFSRSGYYRFLLESNVLLHRQATEAVTRRLKNWLAHAGSGPRIRVLDLACGGLPVSIGEVMGAFPGLVFDYTGIDLNPDQVAQARGFRFPASVGARCLIEANAWDLDALGLQAGYDLIYSGMNLHHGTPEEIRFLGLQLRRLIARGGLFVSHDVYRPECTAYRRRPDVNPADPTESFRLVAPHRLEAAGIARGSTERDGDSPEPAWRRDYVDCLYCTLIARGGEGPGAESTLRHVRERDYPISTKQFRGIFEALGFRTETSRYEEPAEPLAPYIALCTAVYAGDGG